MRIEELGQRGVGASPYVDFHTHRHRYQAYAGRTDVIAVQSVMYGPELPLPEANYVTLGIHPMQDDVQELVRRLRVEPDKLRADLMAEINALGDRCCGIGECGWDRRSVLSWEDQDALMAFHYALARDLGLPLVLHIVGGVHRLLALKSSVPSECVGWFYHGFRGKPATLVQLISAGVHVSLSPTHHTPKEIMMRSAEGVFFLETDDSDRDIETVYGEAASLLDVDVSYLRDKLLGDFKIFLSK